MPERVGEPAVDVVAQVVAVVGDDQDRQVRQRQHDRGEDQRVLGDLDRVDGGQQQRDAEQDR